MHSHRCSQFSRLSCRRRPCPVSSQHPRPAPGQCFISGCASSGRFTGVEPHRSDPCVRPLSERLSSRLIQAEAGGCAAPFGADVVGHCLLVHCWRAWLSAPFCCERRCHEHACLSWAHAPERNCPLTGNCGRVPEVPKHSLKQRPTPPLTWVSLRWTFQARPSEVCGLPGTVPWRAGGHMGGVVPGCGGSSWRVFARICASISPLEDFNTHTRNKKKLLMSLARLPWEPVANESLGFPFTSAEQHQARGRHVSD